MTLHIVLVIQWAFRPFPIETLSGFFKGAADSDSPETDARAFAASKGLDWEYVRAWEVETLDAMTVRVMAAGMGDLGVSSGSATVPMSSNDAGYMRNGGE